MSARARSKCCLASARCASGLGAARARGEQEQRGHHGRAPLAAWGDRTTRAAEGSVVASRVMRHGWALAAALVAVGAGAEASPTVHERWFGRLTLGAGYSVGSEDSPVGPSV